MSEPRTGDLWVVSTPGFVAAVVKWLTRSPVSHAGVYLPDNMVGEAETGGYRIVPNTYGDKLITVPVELTDVQRAQIPVEARKLVGTPYNFLDILALAIALTTKTKTPRFIAARLSRGDRLICSQADDYLMRKVGKHLFSDGRPSGDVTPGDILSLKYPS